MSHATTAEGGLVIVLYDTQSDGIIRKPDEGLNLVVHSIAAVLGQTPHRSPRAMMDELQLKPSRMKLNES
ncbi:uncharacterized [Tachysurus ichikawai]